MAHLKPFLTGTILFSSISPEYEAQLKDELYACLNYMRLPVDVYKLPIRDRKYYIKLHNEAGEKRDRERSAPGTRTRTVTGEELNDYV